MMTPQQMISELVAGSIVALQTVITMGLLAVVPADRYELLEWTLLPFLGASGAAAICFCFNTQIEVRKIVLGRCLVAVGSGIIGTRIVGFFHPSVLELLNDPIVKLFAGAFCGYVGWMLSKPFVQESYRKAEGAALKLHKEVEDRLAQKVACIVADRAAVVAVPIAEKVDAVAAALEKKDRLPSHMDVTIKQEKDA